MSDLSYLLSRRREKQRELKTYKSRKSKLQDVKRSFESDFDGHVSDAIKFNERTEAGISHGLKGEELTVRNLCFDINNEKEKNIYSDSNMYDISANINSEISRCTSEIERLESEIRRLDRQIEAARDAEE